MHLEPRTGPSRLFSPGDVRSHLAWAAGVVRRAEVIVRGAALPCAVHALDDGRLQLRLTLAPLPMPPTGSVLQVQYTQGRSSYAFLTNLRAVSADELTWAVDLPSVIERSERRAAQRKRAAGIQGLDLRLVPPGESARPFPLEDLSIGGVAFLVPQGAPWAQRGRVLRGALALPTGKVIPVEVELRNRRSRGDRSLVGARFRGMLDEERGVLACAILGLPDA